MTSPAPVTSAQCFNACCSSSLQDLGVCNSLLPTDSRAEPKPMLVEFFQFLRVSFVQCLGFGSVQQGGQNHIALDLQFRGQLDVVMADHNLPQSP